MELFVLLIFEMMFQDILILYLHQRKTSWSSHYLPVQFDNIVSVIRWHIMNISFKNWLKLLSLCPPSVFEVPNRKIIKVKVTGP